MDKILIENGEGKSENARCKKIQSHSVEAIIETVSRFMKVSVETIRFRGRPENTARDLAVYLAQKYCDETNLALGRKFGGITGSGISYKCQQAKKKLNHNRKFRRPMEKIEKNLSLEA